MVTLNRSTRAEDGTVFEETPSTTGGGPPPGNAWVDGGNSFGHDGVFGTNDAFATIGIINGVPKYKWTANGNGALLTLENSGAGAQQSAIVANPNAGGHSLVLDATAPGGVTVAVNGAFNGGNPTHATLIQGSTLRIDGATSVTLQDNGDPLDVGAVTTTLQAAPGGVAIAGKDVTQQAAYTQVGAGAEVAFTYALSDNNVNRIDMIIEGRDPATGDAFDASYTAKWVVQAGVPTALLFPAQVNDGPSTTAGAAGWIVAITLGGGNVFTVTITATAGVVWKSTIQQACSG